MPKVSIIVPVYNVERFLDRCIQSVIRQTYHEWELILVDDGSPDKSGEICDAWSIKDNRIRVFHKDNGGVSSARNLGLKKMSGEYVTFLDSDDWLDEACLQTCMDMSLENNLDVLQFSWTLVQSNGISVIHKREDTPVCDSKTFANLGKFSVSVCGGFYNSKIITKNNIRFNESMAYAEDQLFVFMCLNSSRRIKAISQSLYNYFENPSGATQKSNTDKVVNSCLSFSRNKANAGCYASYIDVHNMYIITELVAHDRLPKNDIKKLYYSLNIDIANVKNNNHRFFIRLADICFDMAYFSVRFYRKYILK